MNPYSTRYDSVQYARYIEYYTDFGRKMDRYASGLGAHPGIFGLATKDYSRCPSRTTVAWSSESHWYGYESLGLGSWYV